MSQQEAIDKLIELNLALLNDATRGTQVAED